MTNKLLPILFACWALLACQDQPLETEQPPAADPLSELQAVALAARQLRETSVNPAGWKIVTIEYDDRFDISFSEPVSGGRYGTTHRVVIKK